MVKQYIKGILHGRCTLILQNLAAEFNIFEVLKKLVQKGCKCTYTVYTPTLFKCSAQKLCTHKTKITKCSNKSRFRQNLAVVLIYHLYYVLRHPFVQKSYFGQNVSYTVIAPSKRHVIPLGHTLREHAYIMLTSLNPTFIS